MSSAAQFTGTADFTVGGEAYRLTIDNMALIEAEGALGESMLDWAPQLQATILAGRNPQVRHLAALVYGGLKVNHPAMTQKWVIDIATGPSQKDRNALLGAVIEAMKGVSMPEGLDADDLAGPGEVGNAPAPKGNRRQRRAAESGIGTSSSGSGPKQGKRRKRSGGKRQGERS